MIGIAAGLVGKEYGCRPSKMLYPDGIGVIRGLFLDLEVATATREFLKTQTAKSNVKGKDVNPFSVASKIKDEFEKKLVESEYNEYGAT